MSSSKMTIDRLKQEIRRDMRRGETLPVAVFMCRNRNGKAYWYHIAKARKQIELETKS